MASCTSKAVPSLASVDVHGSCATLCSSPRRCRTIARRYTHTHPLSLDRSCSLACAAVWITLLLTTADAIAQGVKEALHVLQLRDITNVTIESQLPAAQAPISSNHHYCLVHTPARIFYLAHKKLDVVESWKEAIDTAREALRYPRYSPPSGSSYASSSSTSATSTTSSTTSEAQSPSPSVTLVPHYSASSAQIRSSAVMMEDNSPDRHHAVAHSLMPTSTLLSNAPAMHNPRLLCDPKPSRPTSIWQLPGQFGSSSPGTRTTLAIGRKKASLLSNAEGHSANSMPHLERSAPSPSASASPSVGVVAAQHANSSPAIYREHSSHALQSTVPQRVADAAMISNDSGSVSASSPSLSLSSSVDVELVMDEEITSSTSTSVNNNNDNNDIKATTMAPPAAAATATSSSESDATPTRSESSESSSERPLKKPLKKSVSLVNVRNVSLKQQQQQQQQQQEQGKYSTGTLRKPNRPAPRLADDASPSASRHASPNELAATMDSDDDDGSSLMRSSSADPSASSMVQRNDSNDSSKQLDLSRSRSGSAGSGGAGGGVIARSISAISLGQSASPVGASSPLSQSLSSSLSASPISSSLGSSYGGDTTPTLQHRPDMAAAAPMATNAPPPPPMPPRPLYDDGSPDSKASSRSGPSLGKLLSSTARVLLPKANKAANKLNDGPAPIAIAPPPPPPAPPQGSLTRSYSRERSVVSAQDTKQLKPAAPLLLRPESDDDGSSPPVSRVIHMKTREHSPTFGGAPNRVGMRKTGGSPLAHSVGCTSEIEHDNGSQDAARCSSDGMAVADIRGEDVVDIVAEVEEPRLTNKVSSAVAVDFGGQPLRRPAPIVVSSGGHSRASRPAPRARGSQQAQPGAPTMQPRVARGGAQGSAPSQRQHVLPRAPGSPLQQQHQQQRAAEPSSPIHQRQQQKLPPHRGSRGAGAGAGARGTGAGSTARVLRSRPSPPGGPSTRGRVLRPGTLGPKIGNALSARVNSEIEASEQEQEQEKPERALESSQDGAEPEDTESA